MAISSVDHFVVLMLENRSFDHLLSSVPGVDGATGAMSSP
jgi:phospholipase C